MREQINVFFEDLDVLLQSNQFFCLECEFRVAHRRGVDTEMSQFAFVYMMSLFLSYVGSSVQFTPFAAKKLLSREESLYDVSVIKMLI